ncbi:YbjN domain-containing protein [Pendulispora brunnea]|uniref:YbjN domain-containing protein n=1 Tax=Pendulispora brunnea TaxID=2905690 RepID=A0ABZ2JUU6_9BACT
MNLIDPVLNHAMLVVRSVLSERWVAAEPEQYTFQFQHLTDCGVPLTGLIWINPAAHALHLRVLFQNVEPAAREEVVQYMTAVNYQLPNGCFAMDPDSGELRFKASIFFRGAELSYALVSNLVESSLEFVDAHAHQFIHVMMGGEAATADAHVEEENDGSSSDPRPPFEQYLDDYLHHLLREAGMALVSREDVRSLGAYFEETTGTRFPVEVFEGLPASTRTPQGMLRAYQARTLRFSTSGKGQQMVLDFVTAHRRQKLPRH